MFELVQPLLSNFVFLHLHDKRHRKWTPSANRHKSFLSRIYPLHKTHKSPFVSNLLCCSSQHIHQLRSVPLNLDDVARHIWVVLIPTTHTVSYRIEPVQNSNAFAIPSNCARGYLWSL